MDKSSSTYKVVGKKKESETVTTLRLLPVGAPKPSFTSGQFLTVYFPELGGAEGKAYSLSSAPCEEELSISVKAIGAYSKKLSSLQVGDTFLATGPYGFFYSEEEGSHLVLVAGGIGVAPFRSMMFSLVRENRNRKVSLFYSVQSAQDAAFLDEFFLMQQSIPHVSVFVYSTREPSNREGVRNGRIPVRDLFKVFEDDQNAEYLLCGSIPFVRDMWRGLREKGVPEERLYTEAFFS